jgi:hypothetical protein
MRQFVLDSSFQGRAMAKMGSRIGIGVALLAAMPLEAVNYWIGYPIDTGYPPETPWYIRLHAAWWILSHKLGLIATDWLQTRGINGRPGLVLFLGGYVEIAFLLTLAIWPFRGSTVERPHKLPDHVNSPSNEPNRPRPLR